MASISTRAQGKPISVADIEACAAALTCKNMNRSLVNWHDQIDMPVVEFTADGERFWLGSGANGLAIWIALKGETRASRVISVDADGRVISAAQYATPPGGRMPRRMTPDEEAKYHKAQRALIPAIADRGPIGEEYRAAWQGEADRALAVIRRQLARTPDSMSIIDFLVFAPKTLLETFSHATVVVLGEVGDTGETRVGPGERSVHRPVELRIRELLRDARRELVDRPALSVAMYGGTAEVDGGLLATSHVLARPLEKGEWVALFLEARKDGLFNLRFGPQGVIRLGGSDADTVVTLPESLGRLEELRPGRMPQQELLNVLRKTALALPPTEIPVAAIIACARAMTCKNMQRARVMWFDSIKEPVLFFTHATVGYWLKSSDDGTLHVWMTNPEQKSPSHFLQLSGDGGLLAAELGPTTGDPPPGAMTADETAKWHQRHAVFRSPTIGAPEGEQFRVFWQGRVSNALTAIRFVMVK